MSKNNKWRTFKMTKKALMGLPEGVCIIKTDDDSKPIFFAWVHSKKERERLWKKIVGEGHSGTTFMVYGTYDEFLKHSYESKPKNNIVEAVEGLFGRFRIIHEIMMTMEKIGGFEHRSELLLLELEKFVESTLLEIILYLKKYLGIENSSEFKHIKKCRSKVFREIFEVDEEKYKLMICNLALKADLYEKNGGHPVIKEVVGIIQHKYGDKLKPVYKKYGERVLTGYGIPVH